VAYVAVRGGEQAILNAEQYYRSLMPPIGGEGVATLQAQLPLLLDRIMAEGSLYDPELAALALAQSGGDLFEAVLLLRAYRSTQPRLAYAAPISAAHTLTVRRISAAFKDIPDGQLLGPTLDYSHRVLRLDLLTAAKSPAAAPNETTTLPAPACPRHVTDWHREQGLLPPLQPTQDIAERLPDLTRQPIAFPAVRAHRLQALARAETGGILSLGYAGMRAYGNGQYHPTVNEVRLSFGEVRLRHPVSGIEFSAGRVRFCQAEVVAPFTAAETPSPGLHLGFAATLGWNEVKVIAAAMLDAQMSLPDPHPAHNEEFVLAHTEPVEASGFCIHYKMPHYVTFGSSLDLLRQARENQVAGEEA
jgi:alpha-D-ribose 1-methylphosphonate 5-triphosphate synthase subunit PhnI